MEVWFLPVITAISLTVCVFIACIVFFCRRASQSSKKINTVVRNWSTSVEDSKQHILREQMLDRFIIFGLNISSLFWSSEHSLVHTDRALVYIRRGLNILAVLVGVFAFGIADVIFLNWGCYPSSTSLDDYNQGLCWNPKSTIARNKNSIEIIASYNSMDTWILVTNLIFGTAVFLSFSIHAYLMYGFVDKVRYGVEGNYTGTIDFITSHDDDILGDKNTGQKIKNYVWYLFHSHVNDKSNDHTVFTPHEINLHRLSILFFDPVSIVFGLPHIIMARSDLAIANFCNLIGIAATWQLYFNWAIPRYNEVCCYYDESTRSGLWGKCDDPRAKISNDPFRIECSALNIEQIILISVGVTQVVLVLVLWLYSVILFYYIISKHTTDLINRLKKGALEAEASIADSTAKHPPPDY
jgi:hypothetical protein